jgi:hypothetical protein
LKRAKARPAGHSKKAKVEIAIPLFGYKNHVSIDRAPMASSGALP